MDTFLEVCCNYLMQLPWVENESSDSKDVTPEFFWRIYDVVDLHDKTWRWIASVSYVFGLSLVTGVFIEKIYYVIDYTIKMLL